jgi:D-3-phosphoglycerate dehydrogenase
MNILLIDPFNERLIADLQAIATKVTYLPQSNRNEIEAIISDYEILILNSKINIDKELIDKALNLKLVIRAGVGLDHFDLPYLAEKGILAKNTAGANADSVGEQTIGMLLALHHKIVQANAQVKDFQWIREENRALEIKGKNVGIIGFGNTGSAVARKLLGFGCKIWAYDKYKQGFGDENIRECTIETLYKKTDILTLHIPLSAETKNWVNAAFFAKFEKTLTFLNLSRGGIVELEGLISALESKKIRAAALDVIENERFNTLTERQRKLYENLFSFPNVILTPHIGGWSWESLENIQQEILKIVSDFSQNSTL